MSRDLRRVELMEKAVNGPVDNVGSYRLHLATGLLMVVALVALAIFTVRWLM